MDKADKFLEKYKTLIDIMNEDAKKLGVTVMLIGYVRTGNRIGNNADFNSFTFSGNSGMTGIDKLVFLDDIKNILSNNEEDE